MTATSGLAQPSPSTSCQPADARSYRYPYAYYQDSPAFGAGILNLAALSFLGLGMQPPTPEWGMMTNEARPFFQRLPWQMIGPGLCIALTVLAVNLSGDALRDLLGPRAQTRQLPGRSAATRACCILATVTLVSGRVARDTPADRTVVLSGTRASPQR